MRSRVRRIAGPALALVGLLAYWVVAPWVADNRQQEFLRAAEAAILTCAAFVFVLTLRRAFKSDVKTSAQRFFLGLTLLLLGSDVGSQWRLLWRFVGGGPDVSWMLTNDFAGFLLWMQIVGVFLMISGPAIPVYGPDGGLEDEKLAWRRMLTTGAVCLVVSYLVVIHRPGADKLHDMLNVVEPYLRPVSYRVPDVPP